LTRAQRKGPMTAGRCACSGREARTTDLVEGAVARAKGGDAGAVHFLYVRFVDEVSAAVRGIDNGWPAPEDVTEMVFARLASEIQLYKPGELPFAEWIMRFAANVARSDGFTGRRTAADQVGHAGSKVDTSLKPSPRVREAVRRLPDDQRLVLVLRHIAGLSPKEVAERLGCSESSVRGLEENGRRALQGGRRGAAPARRD
jgi:RNA polymerase sigma-70 factor (ECF subfamily)